jgi:hypothetical protein
MAITHTEEHFRVVTPWGVGAPSNQGNCILLYRQYLVANTGEELKVYSIPYEDAWHTWSCGTCVMHQCTCQFLNQ